MNAVKFLESQHREVEELFAKIEGLGDKAGRERKALFEELARKFENHSKIEEKLFYPEGKEVDSDLTLEAYVEHDAAKALVRKLKKTRAGDETFMAKITVLKEMIQHHVKEEEEEYFPECEKTWGEERLEEMGAELEAAFERLEKGVPKKRKAPPTKRPSTKRMAA